jgi:hypothetical protein
MPLTKVMGSRTVLFMGANGHIFLVFTLDFDARRTCRMSFLIDASSFLVGTFFSKSLRPFSMRGVL